MWRAITINVHKKKNNRNRTSLQNTPIAPLHVRLLYAIFIFTLLQGTKTLIPISFKTVLSISLNSEHF